jgi:hypothetical protein
MGSREIRVWRTALQLWIGSNRLEWQVLNFCRSGFSLELEPQLQFFWLGAAGAGGPGDRSAVLESTIRARA